MAGSLRQALVRRSPLLSAVRPSLSLLSRALSDSSFRKGQLVEIDLSDSDAEVTTASAGEGSDSAEEEISANPGGMSRLDEAIHSIVAQRAAPDWLPFLPGSSYWVPPMKKGLSYQVVEIMGGALSKEERLSYTTGRGWPSSTSHFMEGQDKNQVCEKTEDTTDAVKKGN